RGRDAAEKLASWTGNVGHYVGVPMVASMVSHWSWRRVCMGVVSLGRPGDTQVPSRAVSLGSVSSRENCRLGGRGGGQWLVAGGAAEHREDDVGSATRQADHGSVVGVALGAFAVVVRLGDRVVVRGHR